MSGQKDGLWFQWLSIVLGALYGVVLAKHWHGYWTVVGRNMFLIERMGYIRCKIVQKIPQ